MRVKALDLYCFRNFENLSLDLDASLHVFSGPNGQGKSNLLEALSLLSGRKSFRVSRDEEYVLFGKTESRVAGQLASGGQDQRVEIVFNTESRKKVLLNGKKVSRENPIEEVLALVVFTPDDVASPAGSSSVRRGMVDNLLFQLSAEYKAQWQEYQGVLSQRQKLLDEITRTGAVPSLLDPWDALLVDKGCALMKDRAGLLETLNPLCREFYRKLSGGAEHEDLELKYERSWERLDRSWPSLKGDKAVFEAGLKDMRDQDIRRGQTSLGPHRDNISFWLSQKPLKNFGSRGQHRCAVLAFKLAEWVLLEKQRREAPLLLLDDVLSELDGQRQKALVDLMKAGSQTFISTTGAPSNDFVFFGPGQGTERPVVWRIENGKARRSETVAR